MELTAEEGTKEDNNTEKMAGNNSNIIVEQDKRIGKEHIVVDLGGAIASHESPGGIRKDSA